ncbi:MAG: SDR family NAD(P)-dependent oxidoreductase [Deltaproteobacteria bacterium]|nr:MAG: SDR family NAD(P)-dependent oxidoreductase [Deltaproteobacteria bacterium]
MTSTLFAGRICLITGSSRGIGLGIAKSLAANGAKVVLHGRDGSTLRSCLNDLLDPAKHRYIAADLNATQGPRAIAEELNRMHGRLDVLIHSAGILGPKTPLSEYPAEAWEEVLRINLNATFLVTQALLPALRKGAAPSVVFISSGLGRAGRADWGAYSVSKFGVEGLAQVWADELREEGIRVNAVNPGGTRTRMRAAAYPEEDPLTLPTPEDIAQVFVWLARPDTRITGKSVEARDWIGRAPAL